MKEGRKENVFLRFLSVWQTDFSNMQTELFATFFFRLFQTLHKTEKLLTGKNDSNTYFPILPTGERPSNRYLSLHLLVLNLWSFQLELS